MNRKLVFGLILLVTLFVIVGCGGGGSSSNTSSTTSTPTDAVKGFMNATMAGQGDAASFLCSTIPADVKQQMIASFDAAKTAYTASGATLDISGLTYTEQNVSGDSGEVVVAGKLKVTAGGQSTDVDYTSVTVPVKQESGTWKVCG